MLPKLVITPVSSALANQVIEFAIGLILPAPEDSPWLILDPVPVPIDPVLGAADYNCEFYSPIPVPESLSLVLLPVLNLTVSLNYP